MIGVGVLLGSLVTGPVAGARGDASIGSNQTFTGLVNGSEPTATIDVLCPGPANTGHPLAHQTVAVSRVPSATAASSGFTGSRGRSIVALLGGPATNASVSSVTFTAYGSRPIPTSLVLPCAGTGPIVFSAHPTSKTARSASVTVTYLNMGAAPARADAPARTHPSRTVTVTQADNGRSYSLHKGDRLRLKLAGQPGFTWTEPASSDPGVLRRTEGSSGRNAGADFLAVSTGTAMVTASDNPNCYPLCQIAVRPFQVDVSVTG